MTKKDLSEADICDRYITPALYAVGWKKSLIRREYSFTDADAGSNGWSR
jgi:type I restriction enzyme, R subunit